MSQERKIRLRSLLEKYVTLVVFALVLLALVGGYLTASAYAWTDTQTDTRTETVQTATWESSGEFSHQATVLNGTAVYDRGETLRDRSAYFRTITPRLNGTFRYTYTASEGGDLTATSTVVLILRSVEENRGGNATEYWRTESTIGSAEAESLSPGDSMEVPFSVDVNETAARVEEIDEQFGGTPGQKELLVEARLQISGTRNSQSVETARIYELPVSVSQSVYEVAGSGPTTNSGSQTEQRTVVVEPGPLQEYGGPLLLSVALLTATVLGGARYRGSLSVTDRERDWLAYRESRAEFDSWVTVARVPEDDHSAPPVEVEFLEGLVDVAIDADRRVVEDRDRNRFLVFEDNRTYVYTPPPHPDGSSLHDAEKGDGDGDGESRSDDQDPESAIDLLGDTETDPVESVEGIDPEDADQLATAGVQTVADLAATDVEVVAEATDAPSARAAGWVERARDGDT